MLAGELLDGANRSRETFAWVLLGFVGASLLVEIVGLFVDGGFVVNAAGGHLGFVSPFHAGALALAVWLVSLGGDAAARARLVVQVAVALVAALLFVGVIAWLGGLTLEVGQTAGLKTVNSLRFLVDGGLLGAAGWFGTLVLQRMPAPVRAQPGPAWGQPQWGQPQSDPRTAGGLSIFDPGTDDSTAAEWGRRPGDDTPEQDGDRRGWWPQQPS